jgi:cysteine desulfurase
MEGGSQEVNRRPGTESVPLIAGFGEACRVARERLADEESRLSTLRDGMEGELQKRIGTMIINSAGAARLPNTSNIAIPGVNAEMLVIRLDLEGFAVSSGSACHSGRTEPSRILTAMGLEDLAASSVRISLGPDTNELEINSFIDTFERVLKDIESRTENTD